MSVYSTLFSQTFFGLLFCYLTITDVTMYLQIIDFQFPSCCTSQPKKLNQIITVNSSTNTPITKKITLARFACLCFYIVDLVGLLRWRSQKRQIPSVLTSLLKIDGEEIVKVSEFVFDSDKQNQTTHS